MYWEKLTAVEDECILELVAKIKELGYHVITDGEFRRSTWHLDFMWGLSLLRNSFLRLLISVGVKNFLQSRNEMVCS